MSSALFSFENRQGESEEWFKRCLPTSVSSPDWITLGRSVSSPDWIILGRKIQKHVLDSVAVQRDRKEGKEKELEATGVKLKRTKCRKRYSPVPDGQIYHVFVDCDGEWSSTLQYGRLFKSKRNENQSSEFLSERTRWSSVSPWKKKSYQWLKTLLWCCCESDL